MLNDKLMIITGQNCQQTTESQLALQKLENEETTLKCQIDEAKSTNHCLHQTNEEHMHQVNKLKHIQLDLTQQQNMLKSKLRDQSHILSTNERSSQVATQHATLSTLPVDPAP